MSQCAYNFVDKKEKRKIREYIQYNKIKFNGVEYRKELKRRVREQGREMIIKIRIIITPQLT